jgi:CRP-like cAMP-binding protein
MSGATDVGGTRLFAGMTPADVAVVLSVCEERVLVAGEVVVAEGDPGDALLLLRSGRVEIFKVIRGDVDRVIGAVGAGDVIGAMSFVDGARQPAGARTTEASALAILSRAAFERVRRERPDVAAPLYRNVAAVLAANLRFTLELYRDGVEAQLEVAGASALGLRDLVEELRPITLRLGDGTSFSGRLLQMDQNAFGSTLVVKDASGKLSIVPYHAIQRIDVG